MHSYDGPGPYKTEIETVKHLHTVIYIRMISIRIKVAGDIILLKLCRNMKDWVGM